MFLHDEKHPVSKFRHAQREDKEQAWATMRDALDFTWIGRSESAALLTETVEVPASFPDGESTENEFKEVSLKDYWRWSIGLEGDERLLSDDELKALGLLIEIDGELWHLAHAPKLESKRDGDGTVLTPILQKIITARYQRVPLEMGRDEYDRASMKRALQLSGVVLSGTIFKMLNEGKAIKLRNSWIANANFSGLSFEHIDAAESFFAGTTRMVRSNFQGVANFRYSYFSDHVSFEGDWNDMDFEGCVFAQGVGADGIQGSASFKYTIFGQRASFSNTRWINADFQNAIFEEEAEFSFSEFSESAYFVATTFRGGVLFDQNVFKGKTRFRDASFELNASFKEVSFQGSTSFFAASFGEGADFHMSTFDKDTSFAAVRFDGDALFTDCVFRENGDFEASEFENVSFDGTKLAGTSNFQSCTFNGPASFLGTKFSKSEADHQKSQETIFTNSSFSKKVSFNRAKFSVPSQFVNVRFNEQTIFQSVHFNEDISFLNATFANRCSFRNANWPDTPIDNAFQNALFMERADFVCDNLLIVSAFNFAIFERSPVFSIPKIGLERAFKENTKRTAKAIRADKRKAGESPINASWSALTGGFRTLKSVERNRGDFQLEQDYYRFEVRTRVKNPQTPWWEKTAAFFYHWMSDYGNSIARPFVALAFMLISFASVYLGLSASVGMVELNDWKSIESVGWQCWEFSWNNVFRPLSALSTDAPREGDATRLAGKLLYNHGGAFAAGVRAIATLQSLLGFMLAFLFALAVRRRFQID